MKHNPHADNLGVKATDKQKDLWTKLTRELMELHAAAVKAGDRDGIGDVPEDQALEIFRTLWKEAPANADTLYKQAASRDIDRLMESVREAKQRARSRGSVARMAEAATASAEFGSGIYRVGDAIFKVYATQAGRMCAKELVIREGTTEGEFEYRGLAARYVPAGTEPMTLAEAKAFGQIYGVCCVCSRTLTDENSIAEGIGPKCAKKM